VGILKKKSISIIKSYQWLLWNTEISSIETVTIQTHCNHFYEYMILQVYVNLYVVVLIVYLIDDLYQKFSFRRSTFLNAYYKYRELWASSNFEDLTFGEVHTDCSFLPSIETKMLFHSIRFLLMVYNIHEFIFALF
jgi:hypothetical protein